jgi:transposase
MGTRKGKRRRFDRAFKQEAVKLSQQAGRTGAEVADGLGINANMLRRWQREHEADGLQAFRGQGQRTVEAEETWGLRRELHQVTEERDILKKALAYFAEHQK